MSVVPLKNFFEYAELMRDGPLVLHLLVTISTTTFESLSIIRWDAPSLQVMSNPEYMPHISACRALHAPILGLNPSSHLPSESWKGLRNSQAQRSLYMRRHNWVSPNLDLVSFNQWKQFPFYDDPSANTVATFIDILVEMEVETTM